MYQQHFGLTERPFSIAPDPRFVYMSPKHREALAHLLYGVVVGGFVQLTGEVGTGKTTICRCLLEQLPDEVDVALILNPRVSGLELVASLCDELKIQYPKDATSIKVLTDALNAYLLNSHADGRRTVLVIDEAQCLSAEVLEQVRLLTNLETNREKLLQIVLVGQPELRDLLLLDDLRQLAQRITARYHLLPISRDETGAYIQHRLQVCGSNGGVFKARAIDVVHNLSQGIPRLINILCDRAMLGAFAEGKQVVDAAIVRRAAREVLPEKRADAPIGRRWPWAVAVVPLLALGVGIFLNLDRLPRFDLAAMLAPPGPAAGVELQDPVEPPLPEPLQPEPPQPEPPQPEPLQPEPPQPEPVTLIPEPEPPQEYSLVDLLNGSSASATAQAWAGLYRLWGYDSEAVTDEQACLQAPTAGLRCIQASGSWGILQRFDRPAILLLVSGEGRPVPVLLRHMMEDRVALEIDGQLLEVHRGELEKYWYGEYRLLWKTPPSGATVLRPGNRSEAVRWLRERLGRIVGESAAVANPQYYDAALKIWVESFQRGQGLTVDGVAGARTFILLNNLDEEMDIPRLTTPPAEIGD